MISLILAMDPNGLIGKKNDLPWHYSEDLKYFKKITLNKTVLMGRKTFESILKRLNKPLPKRKNIVVSRSDLSYKGITVIKDLDKFLSKNHQEEIFVIGGKTIYEQSIKYADKLYITYIKKTYEGDTYLKLNLDQFKKIKEVETKDLIFTIYERI
ncbi:MAG: dihydrofolate reductase [Bacillota bacterium]